MKPLHQHATKLGALKQLTTETPYVSVNLTVPLNVTFEGNCTSIQRARVSRFEPTIKLYSSYIRAAVTNLTYPAA